MGVGKTTFLELMRENLGYHVINEPVNSWGDEAQQESLLDCFYRDPQRWAFAFQTLVLASRLKLHTHEFGLLRGVGAVVADRSVLCDKFCFAQNCFEQRFMNEVEWAAYQNVFSWVVPRFVPKPDGIIYLKACPEVCLQRIRKRSRAAEQGVLLSYLESLDRRHDEWLLHAREGPDAELLVLDANSDFEGDAATREQLLSQVERFLAALSVLRHAKKPVQGGKPRPF